MCKVLVGRKNVIKMIFASCLFLFICGCGKAQYETNTLVFNKDGSFDEYLVEDFDTNVYDFEELKRDTEEFITNYNASNKYKMELTEIKLEGDVLRSVIKYDDDDVYYDFNNLPIFYGTVAKAVKAGYSMSTPVIGVENGESVNVATSKDIADSHIVILNIATDVSTYKDIKYATENVKVSDDHKRATVEGGSTAYIVFD